ncbi:MAG TPA: hypothetical protein VGF13_20305 [Verrucomicrobiae bacterium]
MKNYLMIVCAAMAMVGCAHNRGGAGNDSQRETGYDRNYKMPKSSESSGAPSTSSSTNSGTSTIDRSSENQVPPNNTTPQN